MKIKVCGNTGLAQIKELNDLGVDYAGLIFYKPSPRYVLNSLTAEELNAANLPIAKVGVFVNADEEEIMEQVKNFQLDMVQLHGDETASFCNHISDYVKVIKAFRISEHETNIDWMIKEFNECCDYFLFDKAAAGLYGGSGEKFDWNVLNNSQINKPFFLSGGIAPEDIDRINEFNHPYFFGVDINSKFELSPGIKDMNLIQHFKEGLNKQLNN